MPAVAHINKFWGRDRGGVEAVLAATVADLRRRAWRVSVLACRPWYSLPRMFPAGVAGIELASPVLARMPVHPGFPRALARTAAGADLVHFHLPFPLAEAAALALPKRAPWVATVHAEVWGRSPALTWCQRSVTARFLQRVDAIIVSTDSAARTATLRPHADKTHTIPFGFDLAPFARAAERRPRSQIPVVLFLGRLVAYKGVDVLLHAARDLPAEVHVVGAGPERERLERMARQLGIAARVRFWGHLADEELPVRFAAADLLVLPSRTRAETFGVVQVEAMAAGLPVVNTALQTGTDWVSEHGITGLTVAPDDAAALAAALRRLIEDRSFRLECGWRAQRRAREFFSIERRGGELEALYRDLLCRRTNTQ
ncbi:MAG TPA: glycosyltransferase [Terriglobales bacterium]|nr:glycosyltransferase [Terriglobales bacterium]